jgi:outer membrane biosynthesis protein TonB
MKKILSLVIVAGFATLIACGPSAEEKAAAEKARQDSINAVMAQMSADSMAAAQASMEKAHADSVSAAMAADSIAKAQSAKKGSKPKPKPMTKDEKKVEEAKKATGGRGH